MDYNNRSDEICMPFLRKKYCNIIGCTRKHIEVCQDWQRGFCSLDMLCQKYHPKIDCYWEKKSKGSCKRGDICSFNHNFKKLKECTPASFSSVPNYIQNYIKNKNNEKELLHNYMLNEYKNQEYIYRSFVNSLEEKIKFINTQIKVADSVFQKTKANLRISNDIDIRSIESEIYFYEEFLKFKSNDKSIYEGNNQLYIDLYETENKIVNIARDTFGISGMKRIHLFELRKRKDKLLSRFKVFSFDDDFIKDFCNSILAHIEESFSIILNMQ